MSDRTVERWDIFDLSLTGPAEGNPFVDVSLTATFSHRHHGIQLVLEFHWIGLCCDAKSFCQAQHMGVHGETGETQCLGTHHVRSLSPNSRKGSEIGHCAWNLTAVVLHQSVRHGQEVLYLRVVEPGGSNHLSKLLRIGL